MRKPVGPYWKAAVAPTFEHERVVYDSVDELLRFFAAKACCLSDVAYQRRLSWRLKRTLSY